MPYYLGKSYLSSQKNFPEGLNLSMLNDSIRLLEYENFFQSGLTGKTILDVGAGIGIIGLKALEAGAEHAYFVEQNEETAGCLKEVIASHPCGHRATVIHDDFHTLEKSAFKTAPDFLFCELWGPHLWNEGLPATFFKAIELFPNIKIVPGQYESHFNIVHIPKSERQIWPREQLQGVNISDIYARFYLNHLIHASGVKHENLSEYEPCFYLDNSGKFTDKFETVIPQSYKNVFLHLKNDMIWLDGSVRTYRDTYIYVESIEAGQKLRLELDDNYLPKMQLGDFESPTLRDQVLSVFQNGSVRTD